MQAHWRNAHPARQPVILNARGEPIRALIRAPEKRPVGFRPPETFGTQQIEPKEANRAA